jgi:hypothetical protein
MGPRAGSGPSLGAVKVTPFRASAAVIVAGLLVVLAGLLVGDSPTPTTTVAVEEVHPEIVPHPGEGPEVVRGAPGSREQLGLFGGLLIALGALGLLGSASAGAARRAREEGAATPTPA